jgi:hypothetical protein
MATFVASTISITLARCASVITPLRTSRSPSERAGSFDAQETMQPSST